MKTKTNETVEQADPVERLVMCDCYPEHCTHGDTCWCEPEIILTEGSNVIVHKEAN